MKGLKVIGMKEIMPRIEDHLQSDGKPGRLLNFSCLNDFYTHKDSGVTDWTGLPGSGKTYFVLEIMFGLATEYGKRTMLYVPDLGSEEEIIEKLVKMHTGKDMTNKYNNKIDSAQLYKSLPWIFHHFVIVTRDKGDNGKRAGKPSPIDIWEMGCTYSDDAGEVDQIVIDSWKNMKHLYDGREDQYLDQVLSERNEMAEDYGKHIHTIAHATKPSPVLKKRVIPTAYDIKGGGAWFDNGKNIITVDFPDKSSTNVNIYVSKTKPENVGTPGSIENKLFLDKRKGRYFEILNGHNLYAFDYKNRVIPDVQAEVDFNNSINQPLYF